MDLQETISSNALAFADAFALPYQHHFYGFWMKAGIALAREPLVAGQTFVRKSPSGWMANPACISTLSSLLDFKF
jgi:hypothetical protein